MDTTLGLIFGVIVFLAGSAIAPVISAPWTADGPPLPSTAVSQRLVQAQEVVDDNKSTRGALRSALADARVEQATDIVAVRRMAAADAKELTEQIQKRTALMQTFRQELATAVRGQATADRALAIVTDEAKESGERSERRFRMRESVGRTIVCFGSWILLAIVLTVVVSAVRGVRSDRTRIVHMRMVLRGSIAILAAMLLAVAVGWIATAAAALVLLLAWIMTGARSHG